MDIFAEFRRRFVAVLEPMLADGRLPAGLDLGRFVVEPPRDASHGDLSTNAAMVYAKEAQAHFKSPRQFATVLAAVLAEDPDVDAAEVAGPGFLNLRLRPRILGEVLRSSLADAAGFGRNAAPGAPSVNIEFVSANPTGPMHVGHGRGAVFGDALAALLGFAGQSVVREYYINDAGAQVDVLARSAFLRYREALGETIGAIPEGLYPGDYLKGVGQALARQHGDALLQQDEAAWLPTVRDDAIAAMMDLIRDDLASLNIRHEVFFSERSLTANLPGRDINAVEAAIADLEAKGLIYLGRLPPPKGQLPDDWEDREQTLFRSTVFGDDVDRALRKSNGAYTYFASDIAYHKTKIDRGFGALIDVLGADHGGYVKRMTAAVAALSNRSVALDVKLCQLVKLLRAGEPVKMSKRSGDFVTLREVVDEVGVDAVRFMMLFRKNDAPLDFDLEKVLEQSKDNPVFYVQYAHARGRSIMRQAATVLPDLDQTTGALAEADFALLSDEGEQGLIKLIAQFPRVVASAAAAHEPHRIAFYVHELASAFHAHWNRGKDHPELRFVKEDQRDLSRARLGLVGSLLIVLKSGLGILGVNAPEEMR
ncbi:arginine--tRNA ligase [Lichenihabitans sp. Uapishka_5]|uniref:arginine--tRNA ligase n=1 Tax=Lichenihabitans sp. Uapishka_5 TaxID=3037302 RepID=UPI0029E7E326|nr:arginine--tRNA ligase [Lichenihabitans sp. Uapishka_5]MDX7949638.1 arginine--tRNA ligase [Lichenihabitans sp. Uapishka_5]